MPDYTPTPVPAGHIHGTWSRVTTAEGLCTDSPVFIGGYYIAAQDATVCYPSPRSGSGTPPPVPASWSVITLPAGTRATGWIGGGGALIALENGWCQYWDPTNLDCSLAPDEFPYDDVRAMVPLGLEPVLMLTQRIVVGQEIYDIPAVVGDTGALPTCIATSDILNPQVIQEVWVGTNGYGIVVFERGTQEVRRYTTADGLPSNTIRAITTGGEFFKRPTRNVWVATDNGIAHWDGTAWTAYTPENGLPATPVLGVASPGAGTVWAVMPGMVAYFDGTSWQTFTHAEGLPEGELTNIAVGWNALWVSTADSGLLIFALQTPLP